MMQPARSAPVEESASEAAVETQDDVVADQQPTKTNTDPSSTRYERARAALKRSGLSDDEFKGLSREQIIRRGLKLAREQDRQASTFAENQQLREQLRKAQTASSTANGATHSGVPAPSAADRLGELLAKHGLDVDDAAKADFRGLLSPLLDENAKLKADLEQRSQANGSEANQKVRVEKVRAELAKVIPELGDHDDFADVLRMMDKLGDVPRFANALTDDSVLRQLMLTAAQTALEEVGERDRAAWSNGSASAGAMDTSSVSASAPRPSKESQGPVTPERAKAMAMNRYREMHAQRRSLTTLRTG